MKNLRLHKLLILLGGFYLVYLAGMFFIQEKLIFFPSSTIHTELDPEKAAADHFVLSVDEEATIDGYFFRHPEAQKTVIFFHGNGGNLTSNLGRIEALRTMGQNVAIFDYRGYGESTGRIKKESDLYADAEAVYKHILDKYSLNDEAVVFWGQSLGGAIAIEMALRHPVSKLVIESSFTSVRANTPPIFQYSVPPFLVKYKFDSLAKVPRLSIPVLIIHSTEDEMISFQNGKDLYEALPGSREIIEITGGHNDGFYNNFDEKKSEMMEFLTK